MKSKIAIGSFLLAFVLLVYVGMTLPQDGPAIPQHDEPKDIVAFKEKGEAWLDRFTVSEGVGAVRIDSCRD